MLIGHMGGPFFSGRDHAAWSIPKGEHSADEDAFAAARREFLEEVGLIPPITDPVSLGSAKQSNGKVVSIWTCCVDLDVTAAVYGTFELEWPRGSGRVRTFPEIDRVAWMTVDEARPRLVSGQRIFLARLMEVVAQQGRTRTPSG